MRYKKFTKDIVNSRLSESGRKIECLDDIKNGSVNAQFRCGHGHVWSGRVKNVVYGSNCPVCINHSSVPLTKDDINSRLIDRGITMMGEDTSTRANNIFICSKGHSWLSNVNNVLRGNNCPTCCLDNKKHDAEYINQKLKDNNKNIELVGSYLGALISTEFKCLRCNNLWNARPANVIHTSGCPACVDRGFNSSKIAYGYILLFDGYIKYGITTNIKSRFRNHKRLNGTFRVHLMRKFKDGREARDWENTVKNKFGGSFVSKETMVDGHTETLSFHLLEEVSKTLL